MFRRFLIVSVLLVVPFAGAATRGAEIDPTAVAKVVADSAAKYTELFAARDAAALAALFTPEAEYVDGDGTVFHGREAIQNELTAAFEASPAGTIALEVVSIRPIAEGLILEEGGSTFTPKDEGAVTQTRYIALHARQSDGSWLLAAVRELAPADLAPHERLKSLAWLVGDWREEVDAGVTKTSWKWSDDGVALLANFTVRDPAGQTRTGTHRVGWDAERKQFRSWIFDSTGGFADGWWTSHADGTWSVGLVGVDSEGSRIGVTLVYGADGPDKLFISQTNRSLGGEDLPDFTTRVVRQPPAPGIGAKP